MDIGQQASAWHDLFVATATTFAALLGLFFVAISLHLDNIEDHPVLRHRTRITMAAMVATLSESLCVLIPSQNARLLGIEIAAIFVMYMVFAVRLTLRTHEGFKAINWIRFVIPNGFALLILASAGSLVAQRGPGLYLFALVIIVGIPVVTYNAWNVLFAPELRDLRRLRGVRRPP